MTCNTPAVFLADATWWEKGNTELLFHELRSEDRSLVPVGFGRQENYKLEEKLSSWWKFGKWTWGPRRERGQEGAGQNSILLGLSLEIRVKPKAGAELVDFEGSDIKYT